MRHLFTTFVLMMIIQEERNLESYAGVNSSISVHHFQIEAKVVFCRLVVNSNFFFVM